VLVVVYIAAEQRGSEQAVRAVRDVWGKLGRDDLQILYVTANTARADYFLDLRDSLNLQHPIGLDFDRKLYGEFGLIVLPTTIIIGRDGKLAHVISSYKSDYEHTLLAYCEHALGILDDAALAERLEAREFDTNRPSDKIARHRATARMLRTNGLSQDAERELQAALGIQPQHIDTRLDLAALYIDMDRIDEADDIVAAVLQAEADNRRARLLRGAILYHRDRLDEAETLLKEVLLLNPDPVYTHYYLGLIAEKQGDDAAAVEHYKASLERLLRDRPM
jgi:tetratricopeptide (TPR) repeat protein